MNGAEIVGDAAQGALAALAAEPAHGESAGDGHTHESACLNCGTVLAGTHCHGCGQAAHVHKTLGAFFHDFLHGVFHFEGKIWRTVPLLAWNPGRLTREYIDGRRASYVSPIALFLFCAFLMFAVVKQLGIPITTNATVEVNGVKLKGLAENEKALAELKARRAELIRTGKPTDALDGEIAGREEGVKTIRRMQGGFDKTDAADLKGLHMSSAVPAIQRTMNEFKTNPGLVIYKVQNNAYKYSWALIPISVPFVWLLFAFRRRYGLYDHTVFVTYSLCFMTLLVVAVTLLSNVGALALAVPLAVLAVPVHMFRQLRGAYDLSRIGAGWRTAAMLVIAVAALLLFTMLILAETGA